MILYAVVNYKTCGWCKKFKPVLERNIRAMNPRSQQKVQVLELDTEEGKAKAREIGFSGGIPCLIARVGDQEVYRQPGFQDEEKFSGTLFTLFSTYG